MPNLRLTLSALLVLLVLGGCGPKSATTNPSSPTTAVANQPPTFQEISFRAGTNRTPVIMYHDAVPERTKDTEWFDVSRKELEEQFQWMQDQGITPISLNDLYRHLSVGEPIPDRSIVLTFDDNYQGFYDVAWPVLKQFGFPVAMFVHTGFVGDKKTGRPKMSWDELKQLVADPLFTVGAHTVHHPDDIRLLPFDKQFQEMKDSKDELEKRLGVQVPFLAYPNGNNDKTTQEQAKKAGFLMAFSIDNGLSEESPGILCVNRYVHTRLKDAWEARGKAEDGAPAACVEQSIQDAPVTMEKIDSREAKLIVVKGGRPSSLSSSTRTGVLDFVRQSDAVAGINGGFFIMSAIKGTDNNMLGPCKTSDLPVIIPDRDIRRDSKLRNRPLVLWGPSSLAIVPYQPETMNAEDNFRTFMPDMTDAFLAGVWLVHLGQPRSADEMNTFASKDIQDPRRRAFMGIMLDGQFVIGASKNSVRSSDLAKAAADAGVMEAVLLDSGFSTSLIYNGEVLASGHSTATIPSRPVPHAIVVKGALPPDVKPNPISAPVVVASEPEPETRHRRRRHRS